LESCAASVGSPTFLVVSVTALGALSRAPESEKLY